VEGLKLAPIGTEFDRHPEVPALLREPLVLLPAGHRVFPDIICYFIVIHDEESRYGCALNGCAKKFRSFHRYAKRQNHLSVAC
jgi:hypothetical protein